MSFLSSQIQMSNDTLRTQFVELNHHQADLLLWCYEQMSIDLSDNEMAELEPLITQLEEIAN